MNERLRRLLKSHGLYREQHAGDGAGGGQGGTGGGAAGGGSGDGAGDGKGGDGGTPPSKTGKSGLDDTAAQLLAEVMEKKGKIKDLNTTVTDLKTQLEQANARLSSFEGIDIEQVKALLTQESERKTKELEAKGQWDALKQQMVDAHNAAIAAARAETEAAKTAGSAAQAKIAELTVGNAFGTSKFITDNLTLPVSKARVLYGAHFEFDGERVVGYDKPAGAANRVALVGANGEPLPFDEALAKLVDADPDKDTMIKSKAKPGAGSGTADGAAAPAQAGEGLRGVNRLAAALAARQGKK